MSFEGNTPRCVRTVYSHEAEVSSELICGRWIFNSLICPYSDDFISHVASKHAVCIHAISCKLKSVRLGKILSEI